MINILSVYRFPLPIENRNFELAKKDSILKNFKFNLLYKLIKFEEFNYDLKNTNINIISFDKFRIEFIFSNSKNYIIPSIQINLYSDNLDDFVKEIIKNLIDSINSFGNNQFFFEIEDRINFYQNQILTIQDIEKDFNKIDKDKFQKIIEPKDRIFLLEKIDMENDIKNFFIFLIYIAYIININNKNATEQIDNINNQLDLLKNNIYKNNLIFSKERLQHINNIQIVRTREYLNYLDNFFSLLK
ncbi:hypothetical protein [Candidatus Vampirococcus lugosii]|uniref:Uncharacterized protein n=1 Tax=Candidatus Vampirococcus lugosii TaxID=2789015 RepID=A0ABS5QMI5_9BACT|nr:hypothetical protein [Candidatus Vampirococcus lugosii]MBS8122377.1 hypothetical protein [Candidatus Vampirococcus lugosii]